MLGNLATDFNFKQKPRPPLLLPQHPVAAATPATGMYIAGTITALSPGSVTVQVTATGPHDTDLQGQTLTIAITQTTTVPSMANPDRPTNSKTASPSRSGSRKAPAATPRTKSAPQHPRCANSHRWEPAR